MMSQNSRREIGSVPPVGSSRKTIAGRCSMAQPSASRCFQPPESSRVRIFSRPSRPACRTVSVLPLRELAVGKPVHPAEEP